VLPIVAQLKSDGQIVGAARGILESHMNGTGKARLIGYAIGILIVAIIDVVMEFRR
jgi:hypothetical protein